MSLLGTSHIDFRAGDWVEIRSKEEILKTLDGNGRLDGLPFMPEMFQYCGQRWRVFKTAHKTCDTIHYQGGRRMLRAVHLEGVRCDGKAHDGCEARCLIFWKEEWLKPVRPSGSSDRRMHTSVAGGAGTACGEEDVWRGTRVSDSTDVGPVYACQATELSRATTPLTPRDVRQYVEDFASGNVGLGRILAGLLYASWYRVVNAVRFRSTRCGDMLVSAYDGVQSLWGGGPYPRKRGIIPAGERTPTCSLGLRPGEWVRIKPYREILQTLDGNNKNRGLFFDAEHVPYCGQRYQVLARVNKIIDETTGKMLTLKNPSIILDGVWCQSRYSYGRMFCPRSIYSYWREVWLQRDDEAATDRRQSAA